MRYFVHVESACAWKQADEDDLPQDPSVEEVDSEEYLKACAAFGEWDE